MIPCPEKADLGGYQYRMFTVNHIEGLLPCSIREVDGNAYLYYDVTGKQSVQTLFSDRTISGDKYRLFIKCLKELTQSLGRYLLDPEKLLLREETVCYDFAAGRFLFVYVPEEGDGKEVFSFLADHIDPEDRDAAASAYRFAALAGESDAAFWSALREYEEDPASSEDGRGLSEDAPKEEGPVRISDAPGQLYEDSAGQTRLGTDADREAEELPGEPNKKEASGKKAVLKRIAQWLLPVALVLTAACLLFVQYWFLMTERERSLCFAGAAVAAAGAVFLTVDRVLTARERKLADAGRTAQNAAVQPAAGEYAREGKWRESAQREEPEEVEATVFLKPEDTGRLYGVGKAHGYTITFENLPLTVGKSTEYADLVLGDPSVSRVHARFERGGSGGVAVCDLGSTNGTRVNGLLLEVHKKKKLERGDEVRIGTLTFVYR